MMNNLDNKIARKYKAILATTLSVSLSLVFISSMDAQIIITEDVIIGTSSIDIYVANDWQNDGSFTPGNGLVIFNGSSSQSIGGTSKTDFNDLTISSGSTTVTANVDLYGTLNVGATASIGLGSGGFTLKSTSLDGDAAIGDLSGGGTVTGTLIAERYIKDLGLVTVDDSFGYQYRYLGVPVTGANIGQLSASGIQIAGNFSDADIPTTTYGSVLSYDATNENYIYYPANGGTMASNPLTNGIGYIVYSYDLPGDLAISVSGEVVTGQVDINVVAGPTDGYNLISNPYPSQIDWDNVTLPAGINNAIYLTDNAGIAGAGQSMVTSKVGAVVTNEPFAGWDGELSMSQAFWIVASADATISFQEDDKTSNRSIFLRVASPPDYLRIKLNHDGMRDESIVRFKTDGTNGFDSKYDAKKLGNPHFNLSQYYADQDLNLVISTLPVLECERTVDLRLANTKPGVYSFTFSELETFNFGLDIFLIDHVSAQTIRITPDTEYVFDITNDISSYGDDRFDLDFIRIPIDSTFSITDILVCESDSISIQMSDSELNVSYWAVIGSDTISNKVSGSGEALTIHLDSLFAPGLYEVKVYATDGYCGSTMLTNVSVVEVASYDEVLSTNPAYICAGEDTQLTASGISEGGFYRWYQGTDSVPALEDSLGVLPIIGASSSSLYYVSIVNASGCEGPKVEVILEVSSLDTPAILQHEYQLSIPDSTTGEIQWFRNDNLIEGACEKVLLVAEAGIYTVSVISGSCESISNGYEFNPDLLVTGIEELNEAGIQIYPNPAEVYLIVNFDVELSLIHLFDEQGRLSLSRTVNAQNRQLKLEVAKLSKGVYVIQMIGAHSIYYKKIIIE